MGAVRAWAIVAVWLPIAARAADRSTPPAPPPPPELALAWQPAAGCPPQADVEAQFVRLLGGPGRDPSGKHVTASIAVRPVAADRWVLDLATVLEGAAGRRALSGDSCASVASAAALILALMIDPAAAARAPAAAAPPAPSPATPATVTVQSPPPAVAAAPPQRPTGLQSFARAFAGVTFGLLPSVAPAAGLALGARGERFGADLSVELSATATGEVRAMSADRPGAGGDFNLVAGCARACGGPERRRRVVWQLCVGGELERVAGAGFGVETPRSRSATMLAGAGGLLLALPLGSRVSLSLDLEAAVRPYHPAFVLDDVGRVYRISVASAFATLGFIVRL